eukprot:755625-Hanusia_phi.AAC.3
MTDHKGVGGSVRLLEMRDEREGGREAGRSEGASGGRRREEERGGESRIREDERCEDLGRGEIGSQINPAPQDSVSCIKFAPNKVEKRARGWVELICSAGLPRLHRLGQLRVFVRVSEERMQMTQNPHTGPGDASARGCRS